MAVYQASWQLIFTARLTTTIPGHQPESCGSIYSTGSLNGATHIITCWAFPPRKKENMNETI